MMDEVGHKATEDSSTSRAAWKSNKKSGCYWRGHSASQVRLLRESARERASHSTSAREMTEVLRGESSREQWFLERKNCKTGWF